MARGTPRVLVAGGDGSLRTAASALVGQSTEFALLPGGTLNHFARDAGVPTDPALALETAATSTHTTMADVAFLNDRLFLNTSSVGIYVAFVRAREQLERRLPYWLASALAAGRLLLRMRSIGIRFQADGAEQVYRSPLVFIGAGERELGLPALGGRVEGGARALHVLIVRGRTRSRLFALGLLAPVRGTRGLARTSAMDAYLVDDCTIELRHPRANVSIDGEIVSLDGPFRYRYQRDALRVVVPPPPEPHAAVKV